MKIINWFIFQRKIQFFFSFFIIIFVLNVLFHSDSVQRKYIITTSKVYFRLGIYGIRDKRDDNITIIYFHV